jgi:deoxyribodipyrimidine photo-lyase
MERTLDAALVWLRRDLRAADHAALYHALREARRVWCAFVFDTAILDGLPREDRRVEFIVDALQALDAELRALNSGGAARLLVRRGHGADEIARLAVELGAQAVYASHDDEPFALRRDARARGLLADLGIALHTSKDHVVFERNELLAGSGKSYSVFTPYRTAWMAKLDDFFAKAYPVEKYAAALAAPPAGVDGGVPDLAGLGFAPTNLHELPIGRGSAGARALLADFMQRIDAYARRRDFPAVKGPSYLSVHLRFGTISVRELVRAARERIAAVSPARREGAQTWLSELAWRDFFHQVLFHHPHVATSSFRPEFDHLHWEHGKHADALFAAWCEGRTGYPLVDAAMAQLNRSGYMHNRLRMVAASFLVKDLGIDWRRGEAYFARHLNDFDLASNNGGWQWSASTGCDAQPWFRIFNPVTQSRRFDAQGRFIRRYLPQLAKLPDALLHAPWQARPIDLESAGIVLGRDYPAPVVRHEEARTRTLARYAAVTKSGKDKG